MVKLKAATLPEISQLMAVPSYDLKALSSGIVHFGCGRLSPLASGDCI